MNHYFLPEGIPNGYKYLNFFLGIGTIIRAEKYHSSFKNSQPLSVFDEFKNLRYRYLQIVSRFILEGKFSQPRVLEGN